MALTYIRRIAVAISVLAVAGCTVKSNEAPPLTGPSGLALTLTLNAIPDAISQDGGSQSSVKVTAIGPDGRGLSGVPLRLDMAVGGQAQDFGTLSARSIVTNSDGVATVVYTAPPSPPGGNFGTCSGLPGNCVSILATATGTNFTNANPQQVLIRLVPTGFIQPPASDPTAAFVFSPTTANVGSPIQFDASKSTPGAGASQITSYSWNFGDGTSISGKTAFHTFDAANSYVVTLTVTNDRNLTASTSQTITVSAAPPATGSKPTPVFTFSPSAPATGETVFFNATTSTAGTGHTISSYAWSFGDGSTGTGATTTHAYGTSGSYGVQLTVTDDAGVAVTSASTSVNVGSPPTPTANFTFSPSAPGRNDQVVFDASSSTTQQGQSIIDVAWNFGDGTAVIHCPGGSATDCPGPTNRISAHTFATAQTFTVNLVVTDSAGRISSKNTTVTIALAQPEVHISASPTSPVPGQTVNFDSSASTFFPGSGPSTYFWNFGDGVTSTAQNPTHAYGATGTYTASLSLTDTKGRTGIGTVTVTVVPVTPPAAPVAAFTFSPPTPSLGGGASVTVSFDGSTSSNPSGAAINNFRWNFGDGTIISGVPAGVAPAPGGTFQAPRHNYVTAGTYTVTLTVTDTNNRTGSTTGTVTVTP